MVMQTKPDKRITTDLKTGGKQKKTVCGKRSHVHPVTAGQFRKLKCPAKSGKPRGRLLFVNKKKQKNFFKLGPCWFRCLRPSFKKSFCAAFFKKRLLSLSDMSACTASVSSRTWTPLCWKRLWRAD
ncbi:MAG TPA: hypothetical protein VL356_06065 [Acidocella sp.]|nr:hypothetical protein [Acidocella sp.]